jgi:hypothetical protein
MWYSIHPSIPPRASALSQIETFFRGAQQTGLGISTPGMRELWKKCFPK